MPVRAVTLVVADDHPITVAGLARLPECGGLHVLATCRDGRAALQAIVEHRPDVALLDLLMPILGGREVLLEVVRRELRTRVVVCSVLCDPSTVHALTAAGARGYVSKAAPIAEICGAVRDVAAGKLGFSSALQAAFNEYVVDAPRPPSARELEVLRLIAEGLTDRAIGERMHISPETVRTNIKRLSEKLGVSGRPALVATAVRRGLIA